MNGAQKAGELVPGPTGGDFQTTGRAVAVAIDRSHPAREAVSAAVRFAGASITGGADLPAGTRFVLVVGAGTRPEEAADSVLQLGVAPPAVFIEGVAPVLGPWAHDRTCEIVAMRRRTLALPASRLNGPIPDPDDVAGWYVLASEMDDLELRRFRRDSAWHPSAAGAVGADTMLLYRLRPATLGVSGLAGFRNIPFVDLMLRRLLMRSPIGGRGRRRADAAFWRGVRSVCTPDEWRSLTGATAILMYHAFDEHAGGSRYVVARRDLRRQLRLLRLLRRRCLPLVQYAALRRENRLVPARSVILTIDDGYADAYTVAARELTLNAMSATLFVPSDSIGGINDWTSDPSLNGRPIATSRQLADGVGVIDVGSHAAQHVALSTLDSTDVAEQLERSASTLREVIGHAVVSFALPFGDEDDRVRRCIDDGPFEIVCTSLGGLNTLADPLRRLRRVEIRGDESLLRFGCKVAIGSGRPVRTVLEGFSWRS